jgi:large subunit ribosomal protein L23
MDLSTVILRPVISEKSYGLAEQGVYTFLVAPEANKTQIRQAVEVMFDVKVTKVNTLNREGKRKRNRRKPTFGKRPDRKRAYVTLAAGERKIELFQS